MSKALSKSQVSDYRQIKFRLKSWVEDAPQIAADLRRVRDERLFIEDGHKSFEEFCKTELGYTPQWANQIIRSTEAAKQVSETIVSEKQPANEAQARALAKAPPEKRSEVWEGVLEDAEETGEKVTAAKVEEAVAKISGGDSFDVEEIEAYQPPEKPKGNGRPLVPTKDREAAVKAVGAVTRWGDKLGVHADIDDAVEHITKVFQNA